MLKFKNNWNNKLFCKHFTTIRISSNKWKVGQVYDMEFNGTTKKVECVHIQPMMLAMIPEYVYYTDTGYSKRESIEIFKKMYKNTNIDVMQVAFLVIVFKQEIEF